ncbi:hypothetical protein TREMEDRAFT_26413, partial [Tremella mesenterica DSM 1558]|uniref:uncharacterized protein n=1 Tax=Tremella mesenterica (strain ATCC 24925 / CBS 8224 / DSM 1558 / NBRC 9311 / NRRL Y-6157 / RJB 2259-6 / UBC 559-6) TaxID=578456 RepID=UPI0003F4920D
DWSLKDFDIGRPLGKGHFGKVYLARVRKPGAESFVLVLKCLAKDEVASKGVQTQVRREIEVMQQLRHPNIIRLYGWFHDSQRIYLMLEYAAGQGELFKHLRKAGRFSESRSARYISQVSDGLAYLHTKNIIHRDIKPENLLLGMQGEVKVGDFGWSVYAPSEDSQRTIAGTLSYVAPEMILGQAYGRAVDIWALGVLTYELVCGAEPFGADNPRTRICRCELSFPDFVSINARSFMHKLLCLTPNERLPLDRIRDEEWIVESVR